MRSETETKGFAVQCCPEVCDIMWQVQFFSMSHCAFPVGKLAEGSLEVKLPTYGQMQQL